MTRTYDIAILGSGIAGTILAAILAQAGVSVLLLERFGHPRFAIGEATTPETSMWLRILAARFDVPEIAHIGPFQAVCANVTSTTGVKRHFGFAWHREGEEQRPEECTQSVIPDFPFGPESHVLRHEVDAYMLHAAVKRGVDYRPQTEVRDVQLGDEGVRILTAGGEEHRALYVVDAGGGRSPLATALGLREEPTRLQTWSRSVFTHMVGVKPYDHVAPDPGRHAPPRWWGEGTLHHIIDGGWMWIIPFDNHDASTSRLCSVGLQLDPRRWPATRSGAEEFAEIARRYPTIGKQLADARPVREWVSVPRLQYSSTRCAGPRYLLLAHAYAFVDPLFSRGITNTMEAIHTFVPRFLDGLKAGDLDEARFDLLNGMQRDMFDNNDQLVRHSYMSFRSFPLWNAWNRVWTLGIFFGGARLIRAYSKYRLTGDRAHFEALDTPSQMGTLAPTWPLYDPFFQESAAAVRQVEAGERAADQVADELLARLRACPWAPPALKLGDPEAVHTDFRLGNMSGVIRWGYSGAFPGIREGFFDFPPWAAMGETFARLRSPYLMLGKGRISARQGA